MYLIQQFSNLAICLLFLSETAKIGANDRYSYKKLKEDIESDHRKKTFRETDSRIIVDRLLRQIGWDIEDKNQVSTEETTKDGRCDYLLKDRRGRPLAVIETKRFSKDP
ncbi:hypothetical protein HY612_05715 [Candidatus Roizmanbacteria bacterium]|nr:hypothetical protein [Candidatus Roizmanbacteria bacterium]